MKRLIFSALAAMLWVAATPGAAHADDTLKRVQQSLRDQGFYYGTIDGSPGDETTQAIRRYQIRNGLQVSGQLTDETRTAILRNGAGAAGGAGAGAASSSSAAASAPPSGPARPRSTPSVAATPRPAPVAPPARTPAPNVRADDDESGGGGFRGGAAPANPPSYRSTPPRDDEDASVRPGPGQGQGLAPGRDPREGRAVPPNGVAPSATLSSLFADTPYEFAPPPVQADMLRRAQNRLLRQGFYDREGDGRPNGLTTEALSNFQGFNRLRRTGRLDTATLATLHLLPGRQGPGRGGPNGEFGDEGPRRAGPGPGGVYEGRVVQ